LRQAPPQRGGVGGHAPRGGGGKGGARKVGPPMRFASARMYMWAPSLSAAWRRLLSTIVARAGVDVTVMEEADPTPLDALWQRADMGCMFMCGYPWAMRRDRPQLLAAPVPSPPRYGDRPVYVTDFIVCADTA